MAKRTMLKADIFALKKDRKAILETVQRMGVIEVTSSAPEAALFSKTDTAPTVMQLERSIQAAENALAVLDEYNKPKTSLFSSLNGRAFMTVEEYDKRAADSELIVKKCYEINKLDKKISEKKAEILRLENQIIAINPWKSLDISQRFKGTSSTVAFIGSFPEEWTLEEVLAHIAEQAPELPVPYVEWISSSQEQTCVFILCYRSDAEELENALRSLGFSRPGTPSDQPPAERILMLEQSISELQDEIEKCRDKIIAYSSEREEIKCESDILTMRRDKYEVISKLNQSANTFMLTGYVPEDVSNSLSKQLSESFDCVVELSVPDESEDVPVALRNNSFSAPTESVVEMYSMPGKDDVDPTSWMAIFYYFLFGMMLSDAGYGLVMVLGCAFGLWKYKNMERGLKNSLKMFLYSGISTLFWGVMFGSYFGDLIPVVARTFFNQTVVVPPLWFAPVDDAMRMMIFSFLIGIIHLYTGLFIRARQLIKGKNYKDAFLDVGLWVLLVTSLIILLLTTKMFADMAKITPLPSVLTAPVGIIAGFSALGIILFAGRSSKNPFKRILKGLYELYGVTSYLSDILSYARLLALGLATGIIAEVFNTLAAMVAGAPYGIGVLLFIVVFLIGHSINIAINALGAYVHTNRLQFVEFFGKFYEGGGRKFMPFGVNTKYYRFKEEK